MALQSTACSASERIAAVDHERDAVAPRGGLHAIEGERDIGPHRLALPVGERAAVAAARRRTRAAAAGRELRLRASTRDRRDRRAVAHPTSIVSRMATRTRTGAIVSPSGKLTVAARRVVGRGHRAAPPCGRARGTRPSPDGSGSAGGGCTRARTAGRSSRASPAPPRPPRGPPPAAPPPPSPPPAPPRRRSPSRSGCPRDRRSAAPTPARGSRVAAAARGASCAGSFGVDQFRHARAVRPRRAADRRARRTPARASEREGPRPSGRDRDHGDAVQPAAASRASGPSGPPRR